ncbi:hypothetical protein ACNSOS_04860 [Aliarcobacter vitoriensis]|uniref:hypothetical protein n=1 Tax=Aliarcobacter vitoriensis TaxID=2011099 RepID=UPI003AABC950
METTNTTPENSPENVDTENNEQIKKSKSALIKKILIISIAVLSLFLIILVVILLFKDSDDKKTVENITNTNENIPIETIATPEQKDFKFDFNNLEPEKLNEQLALLTNKNMEIQKIEELNKIEEPVKNETSIINKDDEEKKDEAIVNNKEQTNELTQDIKEKHKQQNELMVKKEEKEENKSAIINDSQKEVSVIEKSDFVKLINIAKIKGNLNKKYLDKAVNVNTNILLCRDNENNIELYYGPFLDDNIRDELLTKLLTEGFKEAYSLEMLEEEFNKRCKY